MAARKKITTKSTTKKSVQKKNVLKSKGTARMTSQTSKGRAKSNTSKTAKGRTKPITSRTSKGRAQSITSETNKGTAKSVKSKTSEGRTKPVTSKTIRAPKKRLREKSEIADLAPFRVSTPTALSAVESGDLQGLSRSETVDSESVAELLDEGNAFEAAVVEGVEGATDPDTSEVTTREVPEDDVPAEYLDRDDLA
jgi:hypothetical protein